MSGNPPIATIDFLASFTRSEQFEKVFKEGMGLVEETANYLDGPGRQDARPRGNTRKDIAPVPRTGERPSRRRGCNRIILGIFDRRDKKKCPRTDETPFRPMPELPEVEITRRGIEPGVRGERLAGAVVRHHGLRWPVPRNLAAILAGQTVRAVARRAKYLVLECELNGTIETFEQLFERLVGSSYQGREHIVIVIGDGGTSNRSDGADRDLAFISQQLLQRGQGRRVGCQRCSKAGQASFTSVAPRRTSIEISLSLRLGVRSTVTGTNR